jgi:aminopeptidase N
MANNAGPGRGVTIHEMFHTYFPMYVRINERRWAWMDEGWADYNTALVENQFFKDDYAITNVFSRANRSMGTIVDLPLITSSQFLTRSNYGYASYPLPAMVYAIIHQHLGEELFLKCYQEYIKRWAKKSPTPYDFFYTFENVSGQDLSWLWIPWFFEFGVSDVAIKSFEENKLIVINQGDKPVPIFVKITYKNGESKLISQSANIWANGKNETQVTIPNYKNAEKISVNKMVADVNLIDNFFPSILSLYMDIEISSELMGQYRAEKFSFNISITKEDGIMYFKTDYGRTWIIYPKDSSNFSSLDDSIKIKFNMDDSGQCTSIDFDWSGDSLNGKRLE